MLEGGTLTSSAGASPQVPLVLPVFGPAWNVAVGGGLVVGTLLGPEGAGPGTGCGCGGFVTQGHPWSQTSRRWSGHGGAGGGGGCLLVENCTVDASIF